MKFRNKARIFDAKEEDVPVVDPALAARLQEAEDDDESTLIKAIGWVSAGLGAVALGLFIGREMRQRYKFNRRTPYDFYAHSGDEKDIEAGLGI